MSCSAARTPTAFRDPAARACSCNRCCIHRFGFPRFPPLNVLKGLLLSGTSYFRSTTIARAFLLLLSPFNVSRPDAPRNFCICRSRAWTAATRSHRYRSSSHHVLFTVKVALLRSLFSTPPSQRGFEYETPAAWYWYSYCCHYTP